MVVPRLLPCGECDLCRRGRIANCPVCYTRPTRPQPTEVLPARFLVQLAPPFLAAPVSSESLSRFAALSDALLAPYSGLVRAGVSPGTLCVILGGGARAALAVVACRALGADAVVLCPEQEERIRLCSPPYGALAALDSSRLDAKAALAELVRLCQQAGLPPHGLLLLETSGSDAGRARALSLLEAGGTAILLERSQPLGGTPARLSLPAELNAGPGLAGVSPLETVAAESCTILGAGPPHPDLLPELLALVERAGLDLAALTRKVAPTPEAVEAAMAERRSGRGDRLALPIVCFSPSAGAGP